MFPSLDIGKLKLGECRRVVLFHLHQHGENSYLEFRHYAISTRQRSIHKGIKRLVNKANTPNLGKYEEIADYLLKGGYGGYTSESEVEDLPDSKVTLPQDYQGRKKNSTVAIRLHEIGPRMRL